MNKAPSDEPHAAEPILLRKARSDDVPALLAVQHAALRALSGGLYTQRQVESILRHVPTLDQALIADRTYFVAESGGRLVACGGWSGRTPGYSGALGLANERADTADRPALIRAMYTHPDWMRRGLGRWILSAAESEAQACGAEIELDALLPALSFYLACGYEALEHRAVTLPDGESLPLVRMRKRVRRAPSAQPSQACASL